MTSDVDRTHLIVRQATRLSVPHLSVIVDTEWRLAMGTDMRFETLANQLGGRDGCVEGLVRCPGVSVCQ